MADYPKIIVALLDWFIANEGTDYLGNKGEVESVANFPELSNHEREELTRLRDVARKKNGWHGY